MYPALRLLLSSLSFHSPGSHVYLYLGNMEPALLDFISTLDLIIEAEKIPVLGHGFNIKPIILQQLLRDRASKVLWLDSDIIVSSAFGSFVQSLHFGQVVIAEEMLGRFHDDRMGMRTESWGLVPGRCFPFALNSGVLFVDRSHFDLVTKWLQLLSSDLYRNAQALPWHERPMHLLGDQDVLCALLGSVEFSHIDICILRRGKGIIQFSGPYGYTLRERALHFFSGPPPFIHSLGDKPWLPKSSNRSLFERFCCLYSGCSPYLFQARIYQNSLVDRSWLEPRNSADRLLRLVGLGSMPLTGLPYAVAADLLRASKAVRGFWRRMASSIFNLVGRQSGRE